MVTEDPGGREGMHAVGVAWRGLLKVTLLASRCARMLSPWQGSHRAWVVPLGLQCTSTGMRRLGACGCG